MLTMIFFGRHFEPEKQTLEKYSLKCGDVAIIKLEY